MHQRLINGLDERKVIQSYKCLFIYLGTLIGLFSQIKTGGEDVRDRAIKFLNLKIKTNSSDLLNPEAEGVLLDQISSIVEVSPFMTLLKHLGLLRNTRIC